VTFAAAAEDYDRFIGRYGASLAQALIAFAGVEPGMRALDVGCGPGALAAQLAGRLGVEHVAAAEPSPTFAQAARERLGGVEVVQAEAEALPFADDRFDAALAQLVLNFLADPQRGVREMARVTRAGGVVAACVWDYAGAMTLLRAFWDAAREVDPVGGAAADEGAVMALGREGALAELLVGGGLQDVRVAAIEATARYEGFTDLWAPLTAGVGPAGAYCAALDDRRRAALRDALRARLDVGEAPFALTARAWAAAGTVPGAA
jgi:SAM-dependent methyltransferase